MFINNLIPVTIGNIIGGAIMVGVVYWFIYLRQQRAPAAASPGRPSQTAVSRGEQRKIPH